MIYKLQRDTCARSTVSVKAAVASARKATDDVSTRRIIATVSDALSTLVNICSIKYDEHSKTMTECLTLSKYCLTKLGQ